MIKFIRYSVSFVVAAACLVGILFADRTSFARTPTALPQAEIEALEALYNSTDGTYWTTDTNWMTAEDPCNWYGINCGSHNWPQVHVITVNLRNNNLNGEIPPEIVNLVELDELLLNDNHLSGTLPVGMDNFGYIVNLCLQNNALTGSILPALGSIGMSDAVNGGLRLYLENNQFSGSIPPELGNLPRLRYLNLSRNQLTGNIPESFGNLTKLWEINLSFNTLEGPIPSSLSSLTQLRKFKVSDNHLTGEIPVWLGGQPYLRELELQHNYLTGSIPKELSGSPFLELLYLAHNRLSGEVPYELGVLANLENFWISYNFLEGQLPDSLLYLNLYTFWYEKTNLCEPCTNEYQSWLQTIPSLKRTGACNPKMEMSENVVGPGGYIVVTGMCWPSETLLSVYLNEMLLGNIQSDLYGSFSFELRVDPSWEDYGWYWIVIKLAESSKVDFDGQKIYSGCSRSGLDSEVEASAFFAVDPDAPAWPSQDSLTILDVPPGIGWAQLLYLPAVRTGDRSLSIGLGDPITPLDLYLQEGGDLDTLPITAGSPPAAARRTGNGQILVSSDSNQIADFYMQFDAANHIILVGYPTQNLKIEVEYLDQGYDTFMVHYDALSGGPFGDGRFKETQVITKTNTGLWQTASFTINDAYFADRDNEGDFRIDDRGDGYEIIRKVTVFLLP